MYYEKEQIKKRINADPEFKISRQKINVKDAEAAAFVHSHFAIKEQA